MLLGIFILYAIGDFYAGRYIYSLNSSLYILECHHLSVSEWKTGCLYICLLFCAYPSMRKSIPDQVYADDSDIIDLSQAFRHWSSKKQKVSGMHLCLSKIKTYSNLTKKNIKNRRSKHVQQDETKPMKFIFTTDHTYKPWFCAPMYIQV